MSYKYTDEQFIQAVMESDCARAVMKQLDLRPGGANYKTINKKIEDLSLDTSHWVEQRPGRNQPTIPLEYILVRDSDYHYTTTLKKRLIREGLLEYRCYKCGIKDWNGEDITLQLDHVSGERTDNRLENLRLLCPNCHSQTPTALGRAMYKGKPYKKPKRLQNAIDAGQKKQKYKSNFCADCNKGITRTATLCKSCENKKRTSSKIEWPPIIELVKMVKDTSYSEVGRRLGVSDNAVRKRIKKHS